MELVWSICLTYVAIVDVSTDIIETKLFILPWLYFDRHTWNTFFFLKLKVTEITDLDVLGKSSRLVQAFKLVGKIPIESWFEIANADMVSWIRLTYSIEARLMISRNFNPRDVIQIKLYALWYSWYTMSASLVSRGQCVFSKVARFVQNLQMFPLFLCPVVWQGSLHVFICKRLQVTAWTKDYVPSSLTCIQDLMLRNRISNTEMSSLFDV